MAVQSVTLSKRGGITQSYDDVTITDVYCVVAEVGDDQNTVLSDPNLPAYYDAHPVEPILVYERNAEPQGNSTNVWDVTITYSRFKQEPSGGYAIEPNPLLRPADVTLTSVDVERVLTKDADGAFAQTTAGEWFDPPIVIPRKNSLVTITRYELDFTEAKAALYRDKVNATTFKGAAPRTVLMRDVTGRRHFEQGVLYWEVTYELEYSRWEEKWEWWQPNVGYKMANIYIFGSPIEDIYLDHSADGAPIPFSQANLDEDEKTSSPWRLDEDGVPIPTVSTEIHYVKLRVYEDAEFNNLNLPNF